MVALIHYLIITLRNILTEQLIVVSLSEPNQSMYQKVPDFERKLKV